MRVRAPAPKPVEAPRKSRPEIGMSTDEALRVDLPWGKPDDVNRTTTAIGVREQWAYRQGNWSSYLYFDNGVLTSITE